MCTLVSPPSCPLTHHARRLLSSPPPTTVIASPKKTSSPAENGGRIDFPPELEGATGRGSLKFATRAEQHIPSNSPPHHRSPPGPPIARTTSNGCRALHLELESYEVTAYHDFTTASLLPSPLPKNASPPPSERLPIPSIATTAVSSPIFPHLRTRRASALVF